MIKLLDHANEAYYPWLDYLDSLTDDDLYGTSHDIAITNSTGTALVTLADHGMTTGCVVIISGTTDYDGEHEITYVSDSTFTLNDSTYTSNKTGSLQAVMDDEYYMAYLYTMDEILNNAALRTAFRGKHVKDQEGKPQIDVVALTEDERTWFEDQMLIAVREVFNKLRAYAKDIKNAMIINQSMNVGEGTDDYVQLCINVDSEAQNRESLFSLDLEIKNTLTLFLLKEWYKVIGMYDDASINEAEYQKALSNVASYAMQGEVYTRTFRPLV